MPVHDVCELGEPSLSGQDGRSPGPTAQLLAGFPKTRRMRSLDGPSQRRWSRSGAGPVRPPRSSRGSANRRQRLQRDLHLLGVVDRAERPCRLLHVHRLALAQDHPVGEDTQ